jgi:hypothetical protein
MLVGPSMQDSGAPGEPSGSVMRGASLLGLTAVAVNTALPPTLGRRALLTATPPKQMAVRDAPIVSLETR